MQIPQDNRPFPVHSVLHPAHRDFAAAGGLHVELGGETSPATTQPAVSARETIPEAGVSPVDQRQLLLDQLRLSPEVDLVQLAREQMQSGELLTRTAAESLASVLSGSIE